MKTAKRILFAAIVLCLAGAGWAQGQKDQGTRQEVIPGAQQGNTITDSSVNTKYPPGFKEEWLKNHPTPEKREKSLLATLESLEGKKVLVLSPVENFKLLDNHIAFSPVDEIAEYKDLISQTFFKNLKNYDETAVRKFLEPYCNEYNPVSVESRMYKRAIVEYLGKYTDKENPLKSEIARLLTEIAKSDNERVIRGEARLALINVGMEESAMDLAMKEIKACPQGLKAYEMPGGEIRHIKNKTLVDKATKELWAIINESSSDAAKKNAATVLLGTMKYFWRDQTHSKELLSKQSNQSDKLKAIQLLLLSDRDNMKQVVEDEIRESKDKDFREKARQILNKGNGNEEK